MKIGMYTAQLRYNGGVERVIKELFRIAGERGSQCFCLCEYGRPHWDDVGGVECLPQDVAERQDFLKKWIERIQPDIFLIHYVKDEAYIHYDLDVLKLYKIPCIAVVHFSFPSPILLDGDETIHRTFSNWAKKCDGIATVSAIDSIWWSALGFRAFHVQNPFVMPKKENIQRSVNYLPRKLLWVGRQDTPKRPEVAIYVLAEVLKAIPDAHLTMIGGSKKGWKRYQKLSKQLRSEKNITFIAERSDISDLWKEADIHLLTSITESFCLVLAEAKAWKKPTAMFEIPFLELVGSGKGLLVAKQGAIEELAKKIVQLMNDSKRYCEMANDAFESLTPFNDDAVWESWQKVFQSLNTEKAPQEVSNELKQIVSQITLAWDDYCERNLWRVEFTKDWNLLFRVSLKPVAQWVKGLVTVLRQFKYWLKK